jgi:hypothetical protein
VYAPSKSKPNRCTESGEYFLHITSVVMFRLEAFFERYWVEWLMWDVLGAGVCSCARIRVALLWAAMDSACLS